MAYNFTKLSEAPIVTSTDVTPNILIEDDGDIKRISADDLTTPQVNADWNETDITSPAFIMNKPEIISGGGNANIVTYNLSYSTLSGSAYVSNPGLWNDSTGGYITASEIVDEWNNGSIIRVASSNNLQHGSVVSLSYSVNSGAISNATVSYYISTGIATVTL